jgi:hypothetical protein
LPKAEVNSGFCHSWLSLELFFARGTGELVIIFVLLLPK